MGAHPGGSAPSAAFAQVRGRGHHRRDHAHHPEKQKACMSQVTPTAPPPGSPSGSGSEGSRRQRAEPSGSGESREESGCLTPVPLGGNVAAGTHHHSSHRSGCRPVRTTQIKISRAEYCPLPREHRDVCGGGTYVFRVPKLALRTVVRHQQASEGSLRRMVGGGTESFSPHSSL